MKTTVTLALLLILCALPTARSQPKLKQNILAISNVTVIDATGAPAKPNMTVVVTGDRITEIAPTEKAAIPKKAQIIDGKGKFVIPGLWDMHVHTVFKGLPETYFPLFIANGVTGVRDMAALDVGFLKQLQKDVNEGRRIGPRIVAGKMVDGPIPIWPGVPISISDEASARQAVATVKDSGLDFIKVYSLVPRQAYFALADEAKKLRIPFAGHVPFFVTATEASDAGQKSIEHLEGVLLACSTEEPELRKALEAAVKDAKDTDQIRTLGVRVLRQTEIRAYETYSHEKAAALFKRFAANGTWQAPTLVVQRAVAFLDDSEFTNDPRLKYVRRGIRDEWKNQDDWRLKSITPESSALYKRMFQQRLETISAMHRAGVKILAATDALVWYVIPGFSLHDELELFVKAGLTPMEALQTATRNPAIYLGLTDTLGTAEQGKKADLVLLEANPLENISNTKRINAVIVNGRLIQRDSLDKMLKEAEAAANKN
ncbi:MAG TPA: amidohydrolase family protein [Pyrinomonadaceae bacterium]|nr:amidohydrolase family protein [Pyrinomonadaceae bacterium]